MAYNFKSIADVEIVAEPTESANVLIEEDGVIKKAPKTAVGGAGGLGKHWVVLNDADWSVTASEGIFEAIKDFIDNGGLPAIINTYMFSANEDGSIHSYYYEQAQAVRARYDDYGDVYQFDVEGCRGVLFFITKNGDHSYYWD